VAIQLLLNRILRAQNTWNGRKHGIRESGSVAATSLSDIVYGFEVPALSDRAGVGSLAICGYRQSLRGRVFAAFVLIK
jgi:hypothetical protein